MTDLTDYKARERDQHRESLLANLAIAAVPIMLVAAAMIAHIVLMNLFGT